MAEAAGGRGKLMQDPANKRAYARREWQKKWRERLTKAGWKTRVT